MYELKSAPQPRPRPPRNEFSRGMTIGSVTFLILGLLSVAGLLLAYAMIASTLPSAKELESSDFAPSQSMRILDRQGNLLTEAFDQTSLEAGRRTYTPLNRISPYLRQATIATEDANFYQHRGIDYYALARAVYYAVQEGDIVSGASTISQQVVKMRFLSAERSVMRKIKEAVLSAEISREYPKDKILEIYLNDLNYGNLAYGAEAAAQTYFNKDVTDLTLGEAALLAGLPQAPAYYDPYANPERAKDRQAVVLSLMVESEFIKRDEADRAWLEPLTYAPVSYDLKAPHFTLFVRQQLEQIIDPKEFFEGGLSITTTLDLNLQAEAERIVAEQVGRVADYNVSNGALVAMRPDTGEILALVGSADFNNVEIDGQVNMALAPRQPGSTIKPLVYAVAFAKNDLPAEERWTPGTLVADIKQEFPDGANPPYVPTNYDNKERGLVTVRSALGMSLNIPAVRAIQMLGVQNFVAMAPRFGITTLTRPDYGLSLSLGAGEIPLVEMTGAFAVLANQGRYVPPVTILKISYSNGEVFCGEGSDRPCQTSPYSGEQVISAVDAFLITDILRDNDARAPVFGANSLLRLDRPAAAKTGTTNDFRDVLTMGYTPQLVTGVWVGNSDNSEMRNISGITGAAPIWNEFMRTALADQPAIDFPLPPGVRQWEVCADTGTQPSVACPERRTLWFAEDRPPLPPEKDLHQRIKLDKLTGKLATEFTPPDAIEEKDYIVYPEQYREWAERNGISQPPTEQSDVYTGEANVVVREPVEGEIVSGLVTVVGSADAPAFASYELQYGISHDPGAFSPPVSGPYGSPVVENVLGQWDTSGLEEGPHTLRLVVRDQAGAERETRVRVFVTREAPPTPVEATPTWTPEVPTPLPLPTDTPPPVLPTDTPVVVQPTPEPTWTLPPLETPTETPTVAPPLEPSPTWTPEGGGSGGGVITDTNGITETGVVTSSEVITSMQ